MTTATPVVVVTGASRGLGRAVALRCGGARWRVAVHYRVRRDAADSVVAAIAEAGGEAIACQADVARASSLADVVERVMSRWGRIDAWINNAGVIDDQLAVATPDAAWDRVIATNLSSAWYALRAVAPVMIEQREGVILNVASLAALQGRQGQSAYAASKAGLIALTRTAARELAPHGIRVNAVCPPVLETESAASRAPALRAQQLLPAPIEPHQAADTVFAVLGLPWISGHTFMLDSRIPAGNL
ncbi:MAG: SDR family NAD(P)-dependent oxidoreductase [Nitrospirae bacterium]|nr:SDR family NAD(P)-dependent oxidoreductase [Nitrospirota bacterium]